jgi:lysophospholipase L1-like esterase
MLQRFELVGTTALILCLTLGGTPGSGLADSCGDQADLRPAVNGLYEKLYGLESKTRKEPVRVLHLGDSHVDTDRISGFLASRFQTRFGYGGRGRFPPGQASPSLARTGYQIQASSLWKIESSAVPAAKGPFGLSGYRLSASTEAEFVHMRALHKVKMDRVFIDVLRQPGGGSFFVSLDGRVSKPYSTAGDTQKHEQIVIENADADGVWLELVGDGPVSLLALGGETADRGVRYEAHGVPSATLAVMDRWDAGIVTEELRAMSPDLILLNFGSNESFDGTLDRKNYKTLLTRQIKFLKKNAPGALLFIVSVLDAATHPQWADRPDDFNYKLGCSELTDSERVNYKALLAKKDPTIGRWYAPVSLGMVEAVQREVAEAEGVELFDSRAAMGGACSIHEWANERPPLAFADHLYLTPAGGARLGEALWTRLLTGYAAYETCRKDPV